MNRAFKTILAGAFLLEAAGYLAFPYLAVQLRDAFSLTESQIGTLFLVGTWSRPLWALVGGWLGERIRPAIVFAIACLGEAACFFLLAGSGHLAAAVVAILLGNMGFSLWTPNLFGLVYRICGTSESRAPISLLTGALNAGAAVGCMVGGLITSVAVSPVFFGAGIAYLLCIPVIGWVLWRHMAAEAPASEARTTAAESRPFPLFRYTAGLILATLGFWASYSQFNTFFALYAKDWLGNVAVTGLAFAGVTVIVAAASFALAKFSRLRDHLGTLTVGSALLLIAGWWMKSAYPGTLSTVLFVIDISLAEACFSVYLAEVWARFRADKHFLMQGLNFAGRNVAMGAGSFLGGLVYGAPDAVGSLSGWAGVNAILVAASIAGVLLTIALLGGRDA